MDTTRIPTLQYHRTLGAPNGAPGGAGLSIFGLAGLWNPTGSIAAVEGKDTTLPLGITGA